MNKEEFIAYCKTRTDWNFNQIVNDKRITWNKSKLKDAKLLKKPFDYYDAIEDFKDE